MDEDDDEEDEDDDDDDALRFKQRQFLRGKRQRLRGARQQLEDFAARTHVAEDPIEGGERCFVQPVRVPGKRVGDHDHFVSELGGVAGRRLTADIRHSARNQHCVDTERR